MDWCVNAYTDANHHPVAVVNGDEGNATVRVAAAVGTSFQLDASASSDPDGDQLYFTWQVYPEAGTYEGEVEINGSSSSQTVVTVPGDCEGKTFHILLSVKDSGEPVLFSYRRVIVTGEGPETAGSKKKRPSAYVRLQSIESESLRNSCLLNGRQVTGCSAMGVYVLGKKHSIFSEYFKSGTRPWSGLNE